MDLDPVFATAPVLLGAERVVVGAARPLVTAPAGYRRAERLVATPGMPAPRRRARLYGSMLLRRHDWAWRASSSGDLLWRADGALPGGRLRI